MRLAIVTGTSRGIGATLAGVLVERGWQVRGVARGGAPSELADVVDYTHDAVDLADLAAVEAWVERRLAPAELASVERLALVNNAGVLDPVRPLARCGLGELDRALRVNLTVPTWLMGAVLSRFHRGALRIVNLSSGAATSAYPSWGAYCASKAGLRMAGEVLARELELGERPGLDVALVSYAPHVVATAMQESIRETSEDDFPLRQRFVDLHESGELVAPAGPATEIADFCDSDGHPAYSEARYSPP